MWTIIQVFIEFVTILLLFYVFWFFGHEAHGTLVPQPGIEPISPALEVAVKSMYIYIYSIYIYLSVIYMHTKGI